MLNTHMDRPRFKGVLFQTLLCCTLIGLCCAGHRAFQRGERHRSVRQRDRWAQRIQFPSLNDQGSQRIEYPSVNDQGAQEVRYPLVNDRGQWVDFPSVNDSAASSQIQKCSPGYYRDNSGPFLGRCVPCDCNGLADECEDKTGRCLNCQYNTAGDRCERCKDGYYGNAAQRTCRICPCPFRVSTNSFAEGCRDLFGDIKCICRVGYTGDRCERCAPGYYGDPLTIGGSCQPCRCNGNGNNCDPRTGVCKNTLEPGDTNTDERCQECDNCAQTLLHDLEKLDDELERIKAQLDNATASASSQDRLKKLEKAIADTKILVNKFTSSINSEKTKVNQLEEETTALSDDISSLKDKADKRAVDADKAVTEIEKTHKRAKDLDSEIQNMLKKIRALLDQLKENTRGDTVPNENLAKMMEDAERMVDEMEKRNFTPQKTAADKERDEAKKLLNYINSNVSKQCDMNEAAAEKIGDLLKGYGDKLKDLDKALKEATEMVKKANTQNGLNADALKDLQKRIDNLKNERKTVEEQMKIAEGELQKTKDLVKKLSDSKKEYEQLAAQLDGAKTDLTKKVNDIARAAAQEDIVEKAENHAKTLEKLAKELEDAIKDASARDEVRNAKDAIDAYKNITDAINAAEAAANEAKNAADSTLNNLKNQKLTERTKNLKEEGDELLQTAKEAEESLKDASDDLKDVKKRLSDADKKKNALQNDLQDVQNELDNINAAGIADTINVAKRTAEAANNTASDTMNRLNDIKKEMEKINIPTGNAGLDGVLEDVDKSVKDLLNTIPSLNDKISEVENLTSQISPISTISENIKKIKELIEQARDAANRIGVPMKFKGDGYVEMRPPKDLEDLKAYTSLSLSLQRPEGRGDGKRRRRQIEGKGMFVMYLGNKDSSKNYIGMVLKDNVLYGVYKLNGAEYKVKTLPISQSAPVPATFDRVDLRRIYQDIEMNITKEITANSPREPHVARWKGDQNHNLLDLTSSDVVFYVGGYPDDFTPPDSLNYPKYEGCIEFSSLNNKGVSLYNFQKAVNINQETPCKRYAPQLETDFYEGTGFSKGLIKNAGSYYTFTMSIDTRSENGLLFYLEKEEKYLIISMEKGVIVVRTDSLPTPVTQNAKVFPTSNTETLTIIKTNAKVTVRMGKEKADVDFPLKNSEMEEFYFGGIPQDIRERHNISIQPFKGCVRNMKQGSNTFVPDEQVGVSKGCPSDGLVPRKAEFNLGSSLSSELTGFSLADAVTISLGFRSTQNQGLILQDKQQANDINLSLENGHVILIFNSKIWKSNNQYNDNQWHYLTITKKSGRIMMIIDDEDEGKEHNGSSSIPETNGAMILGKGNFKGCISNLYTRRPESLFHAEDLSTFTATGEVLLDTCAVENPAQLMLDRTSRKEAVIQRINESLSECALPAMVQHAYRLGGPVSSLSYSLPLQVLQPRPHFSLDIRTKSPEGLLFFAATRGGRSHLALYLSKGRIRLSVGKQKEIFNREKYNDGKWHSVIFSLEKKKFRLVVDGIRALDGQLTNSELTSMQHFVSPVYLGSAPESLHRELKSKALPKHSVSGCIRSFKMNGAPMLNPTTNHGAGPCFEGQTQRGAYFSGNGAHVTINNTFVIGSSFELLFNIRPRSLTGLLLHVGDSSRTQYELATAHYLTVYMLRGEVFAQANNGQGEFMVKVKPKSSLCDGGFHKISVIKRKNVVQLHVDTIDNYKIGPPTSSTSLTKYSLYVGGIPDMSVHQTLPVTSSFMGCIQDLRINSEPVSFDRLSGVFGPVNLKECPG